ncbi:MAG: alpha/beta hydrolase [Pseudomonadota bacterium]
MSDKPGDVVAKLITSGSWDRRSFLVGAASLSVSACARDANFVVSNVGSGFPTRQVLVASNRVALPSDAARVGRSTEVQFSVLELHTPLDRRIGELPKNEQNLFELAAEVDVPRQQLRAALQRTIPQDAQREDPLMLWVHGFNNTPAEAISRQVQIVEDVGHVGPAVSFVWPSAGRGSAYIHDRDSAIHARVALSDLLLKLRDAWPKEIVLVAHSLGVFLALETLIKLQAEFGDARVIDGLLMVQPDVAPDVFESQIMDAQPLPPNSVLIVSQSDPVLRLSAFLSSQRERVGATSDSGRYRALGLTVLDLTSIEDAGNAHLVPFSSPTVLKILGDGLSAGLSDAPERTPPLPS